MQTKTFAICQEIHRPPQTQGWSGLRRSGICMIAKRSLLVRSCNSQTHKNRNYPALHTTVGLNPILSDLGPTYRDQGLKNWTGGTWDIIKLIGMNSRFALIHKKAQEQKWLKNWTILKRNQISALFSTQRPPDEWPDALDHLAIDLVANKSTKLGKTSETLLLSQGLSYMKITL